MGPGKYLNCSQPMPYGLNRFQLQPLPSRDFGSPPNLYGLLPVGIQTAGVPVFPGSILPGVPGDVSLANVQPQGLPLFPGAPPGYGASGYGNFSGFEQNILGGQPGYTPGLQGASGTSLVSSSTIQVMSSISAQMASVTQGFNSVMSNLAVQAQSKPAPSTKPLAEKKAEKEEKVDETKDAKETEKKAAAEKDEGEDENTVDEKELVSIGNNKKLKPAAAKAYLAAEAEIKDKYGVDLKLTSAYRSHEHQKELYEKKLRGEIAVVAKPGTSLHEKAEAIDIGRPHCNDPRIIEILAKHGFIHGNRSGGGQPIKNDPYHFSWTGADASA